MSVAAPERTAGFPEGEEIDRQIETRKRQGAIARSLFLLSLIVAVLALLTLLVTVINQSFGLVATVDEVSTAEIMESLGAATDAQLDELDKDQLVAVLMAHLERNPGRRLEREQRFYEDRLVFETQAKWDEVCSTAAPPPGCSRPARSRSDVLALVIEEVVKPQIVGIWNLGDSLFQRPQIEAEVNQAVPGAELSFRSWVSGRFLTSPQDPEPATAGIRTAILGSLWVLAITILFAFPVGVAAAIYLEEYAADNWVNRLLGTNISNLAGVPSIIYGMLGLAIFVRTLQAFTSGAAFGAGADASANGRTILAAGLTLGLLVLPVVIISSREAIRAVPQSLRRAGLALGATRWQTIRAHVLPNALPGILTGTILAMARAFGETAPLVVVGASTFITADPTGPFSKFTVLPIQIYQWTARPQPEFRNIAAAAILVLLVLLLTLNAAAIVLRNRFKRTY